MTWFRQHPVSLHWPAAAGTTAAKAARTPATGADALGLPLVPSSSRGDYGSVSGIAFAPNGKTLGCGCGTAAAAVMAAAADMPAPIAGPDLAKFIQPPVTVSPKPAEWVIGVLLRVTAVTVTVYDPAGVDDEVGMERIDEPESDATGEPQSIVPARLARAEAYWLHDRVGEARREAELADDARARSSAWERGDVAVWLRRTGSARPARGEVAPPHRRLPAGDPAGAARDWAALGCPYDAALALIDAELPGEARRILTKLTPAGKAVPTGTSARSLLADCAD